MAEVNSLYPRPPQPQENLLAGDPLRLLGALGQINQLRRFEAEFGARKAIGSEYSNALRPDGTVDVERLSQGLKRNPAASYGLPEATSAMLAQTGQMTQNATALFEQQAGQNKYVLERIGSLADKPDLTPEDVSHEIVNLARTTSIPSAILTGWLRGLPRDPAQLRERMVTMKNMAIGAPGLSGRVEGPRTETGEPTSISVGQANYAGAGGPAKPAVGIATGLPPGSEKSAAVLQEDLARARNFGQELFPWQQALEKLKALGPGGTAPGSKGRQEFASFLYGLSPTVSRWAGVDPEKIRDYAEAEKYLTQATMSRAASFGTHTDQALAQAISGNPNVHINDLANVDVVKAAIALRRMEQAQTLEASKAGPVGYTASAAKWASTQDPRAFAIDLMPPEQIKKLQKDLKGKEREKFNASLKAAIDNGLIQLPGQ